MHGVENVDEPVGLVPGQVEVAQCVGIAAVGAGTY